MKIKNKKIKEEFLKYFIIGCSSVILDLGTLYVFKIFFNLSAVFSVIINQIIVLNYVFFLNKFWTFYNKKQTVRQLIKFLTLAIINYLIAITWMWVFNELLKKNYLLVRISNIILATSWNFFAYKFFVYKKSE